MASTFRLNLSISTKCLSGILDPSEAFHYSYFLYSNNECYRSPFMSFTSPRRTKRLKRMFFVVNKRIFAPLPSSHHSAKLAPSLRHCNNIPRSKIKLMSSSFFLNVLNFNFRGTVPHREDSNFGIRDLLEVFVCPVNSNALLFALRMVSVGEQRASTAVSAVDGAPVFSCVVVRRSDGAP